MIQCGRWLENILYRPYTSRFHPIEHRVNIHTSGNFLEDNFTEVMVERTCLIIAEINLNHKT